jgi:membrane-associated phospholipid phosphatase
MNVERQAAPMDPAPGAGRVVGARRSVAVVMLGMVLAAALLPLDRAIADAASSIRPRGDVRRELEAIQQFGGVSSLIVMWLVIWRVALNRFRAVLDWALAAGLTSLAVFALKCVAGRPRPKFGEGGLVFLGPFRARAPGEGASAQHAWEFWNDGAAELWSMPSSHTAAAVVAAVCLSRLEPRLRVIVIPAAVIVGAARVLLGAHFASDVVVGAAIGFAIAHPLAGSGWVAARFTRRGRPGG